MSKINTRVIVWAVVVIVVVVGLVWYALSMQGPVGPGTPPPGSGITPVYAPQGQVVPGFPKQLILDNAAAVSNSYSVNYSASANQYTVQWNSSSSMTTLYTAYKAYLPANGWTITNNIITPANFRGLYATNASSVISIAMNTQGKGSQVIITYVVK
jgi:hypothetical protein